MRSQLRVEPTIIPLRPYVRMYVSTRVGAHASVETVLAVVNANPRATSRADGK